MGLRTTRSRGFEIRYDDSSSERSAIGLAEPANLERGECVQPRAHDQVVQGDVFIEHVGLAGIARTPDNSALYVPAGPQPVKVTAGEPARVIADVLPQELIAGRKSTGDEP